MVKPDKKALVIAHEIKLTKILAGNNKKLRERTLKRLKKWLSVRTTSAPLTQDAFLRLWKGLFYAMWMSDKPLIQEECAENISQLIHMGDVDNSLMFFKSFLQTMVNEWFGIDHFRLDKFLMLVRRVLRQMFEVLKQNEWNIENVREFATILNQTVFKPDNKSALGLSMHMNEIYLEELAKISKGKLETAAVLLLIEPFAQKLARSEDDKDIKHIASHIFRYLMKQSDAGIEYQERFHAWRQRGFPGGTIETIEKVQVEADDNNDDVEEDYDDQPKDPRAGKVNVILPQLQFNPNDVADMLNGLKFKPNTTSKGQKLITRLVEEFREVGAGKYPLGVKRMPTISHDGYSTKLKSSLRRLNNFEQSLEGDTVKAKARKQKKRKINELAMEELEKYDLNLKPTKQKRKERLNNVEASETFEDFVAKSEAHLTTAKSKPKPEKFKDFVAKPEVNTKKSKNQDDNNIPVEKKYKSSTILVRNSGTWYVDDVDPPQNEWKQPLKDGESDIFVVSRKTKKKLKKLAEKKGQPVIELVKNLTRKVMNGDAAPTKKTTKDVVKNPFAAAEPAEQSNSQQKKKRINFDLSFNRSQDIQEHFNQIMSSPGIPFDASRKPSKPLLKPSPINMSSNPFYKKKRISIL